MSLTADGLQWLPDASIMGSLMEKPPQAVGSEGLGQTATMLMRSPLEHAAHALLRNETWSDIIYWNRVNPADGLSKSAKTCCEVVS